MTASYELELTGYLGPDGLGELFDTRPVTRPTHTVEWIRWIPPSRTHQLRHCDRVLRIVQTLAALDHPAWPGLTATGALDGGLVVACEPPIGHRLNDLPPSTWTPETRWEVLAKLAEALASLHDATEPGTDRPLRLRHRHVEARSLILRTDGSLLCWQIDTIAGEWRDGPEAPSERLGLRLAPEQRRGEDLQATDIFLAATLVRELGGDGSPPLTEDLRALLATATADDPERRPTAAALWRLARDKITQPRLAELARGRDVPWRRPDELHGLIGERVALTSLGDPPPSDRPAETPVGGERDLRTALPHDLERFRSLLSGSDGEA